MTAYTLYGAETSPYSLKVRSYLRYKKIGFEWVARTASTEEEFRAKAASPTVPLLVFPNRPVSQDSTSMLLALESDIEAPAATPDDDACAALAYILEDYADEWLNKIMFSQRWGQMPDRAKAASRVLRQITGSRSVSDPKAAARQISDRMAERLPLVGADSTNASVLNGSLRRFSKLLNAHLSENLFIFGGAPSIADFAIAAQFQQLLLDPTPSAALKERAPFVTAWCEFMDNPKASGPFKPLDELKETLLPLIRDEVGKTYIHWAAANGASASRRRKKFSSTIEGSMFEQPTQKFAAKSFKDVKKEVAKRAKKSDSLSAFLQDAGISETLLS